MSINKYKTLFARNIFNIPGWRTKRNLVAIESDDWGSQRMPSVKAYNELLRNGLRVDKCSYCTYDSLESENDLSALYEVLNSFQDLNGNSPVITANFIMANPDFEKIKKSCFVEYHYEKFTETYKSQINCFNSFKLVKEGLASKIFVPQLHGREHLNVNRWMKALKNGSSETREAFNQEVYGISTTVTNENRKSYLPAFDFDHIEEVNSHTKIINEAVEIFGDTFGYNSTTFIAPNYTWHKNLEKDLLQNGINVLQGSRYQEDPLKTKKNRRTLHYTGEKNNLGQIYTSRNCLFEPSESKNTDWIGNCLKEIEIAFRWNKPAIISAHRLNFMGSLVEENRTTNLNLLRSLLEALLKKWPTVEFISSADLEKLIKQNG